MTSSRATTVRAYLAELPADRRKVVAAVRRMVLERLPAGYEEVMNWGMITYQVPLTIHPTTYNGRPLMYAALAAQKNYFAIYLMGVYASSSHMKALTNAYKRMGKKLDMGKSCLRFKSLDDLPLKEVGDLIAAIPPGRFVALVRKARG